MANATALSDNAGESHSLIVRQPLGIVDPGDSAGITRHDHGARDDGPRNGTAPYFVDTRE